MELTRIHNTIVECPICGNRTLEISVYVYEAPLAGKVLLDVWKCSNCSYRRSDVELAEHRDEVRISFEVKSPEDLRALVVKSSSATIVIPELGIEISPGPAAQGYITTVEGVLERVLDNVPSECLDESNKCNKFVKDVTRAMNSEMKFTVILIDPLGKSTIQKWGT